MTALLCDWGGCCALGLRDLSWCFPCTLFGRLSSAQYSSETTNTNRIMFPLKLQLCPRGIHKVDLDPFLSITHKVADICILYPAFSLVKSKAHIIPSVEPTASIWYQSGVFSSFFFFLVCFYFSFKFRGHKTSWEWSNLMQCELMILNFSRSRALSHHLSQFYELR